jgi:DNA-binding transcriptional regulator YdaS (Cro superfamily)
MKALKRAIEAAGGVSALAAAINASPQTVINWRNRKRVPPERCADIERATGGAVTRHELRPDIFGEAAA